MGGRGRDGREAIDRLGVTRKPYPVPCSELESVSTRTRSAQTLLQRDELYQERGREGLERDADEERGGQKDNDERAKRDEDEDRGM